MTVVNENYVRPRRLPQYIASQSAAIGIFAAGLIFGWTSSAGDDGKDLGYGFGVDPDDFTWITSIFEIGAAVMCVPTGFLADSLGRRTIMLTIVVPMTVGWALVIWPTSVAMVIIGRFLLGTGSGVFFVTLPMYIAEISDKESRGKLSTITTLAFYGGILVSYVMGLLGNMHLQSIISGVFPIIFFAVFFFMPETPTYHLMKGDVKAARKSLIWFRGTCCNVDSEFDEKREGLVKYRLTKDTFIAAMRSSTDRKGLLIGHGLIFFQAFSGIDAILAYDSSLFSSYDGDDGKIRAIVVGTVQLVAMSMFGIVVDKWGRRPLLIISGSIMCLSSFVLAFYYYAIELESALACSFDWMPLVCISCFVVSYSFGFAAITWIIAELFSPRVKAIAMSSANTFCWLMAFVVVKFFDLGKQKIGLEGLFWTYSVIIIVGMVFVYRCVPETKNKSLEQIQMDMETSKK